MIKSLKNYLTQLLLSEILPLPEDPEVRKRRIAKNVVGRIAEGNVRLTQGRYKTRRQMDADYKKICKTG